MTNEEARAYFIDCNEKIISVAKDENIYNYETQQVEDVFMRRTFEANELAIKALDQKPKSEWQQDHEILKAYSNGANDMLDKIKAEMANHLQTMDICNVEKANGVIVQSELTNRKVVLYDTVLHIIDEYKEEGNKVIHI